MSFCMAESHSKAKLNCTCLCSFCLGSSAEGRVGLRLPSANFEAHINLLEHKCVADNMTDAVGDEVRRVLGVTGCPYFEEWIQSCCTVCIVTTSPSPELLTNPKFDLFRRLGVDVQSLELPAVPKFVSGTK